MPMGRSRTLRSSVISAAVACLALLSACSNGSNGTTANGSSGSGPGGTTAGVTTTTTGGTTTGGTTTGGTTTGSPGGTTAGTATATTGGTTTGGTALAATAVAKSGFSSPFDAVLDSTGATVYFTAMVGSGTTIFSAPANGSAATSPNNLSVSGLVAPIGLAISTDNTTLYAADVAFEDSSSGALGQVVSVAVSGGSASPVSGTPGYAPIGLAVVSASGSDTLYFTGTDPGNGKPGLFSVLAAGGTPTVVAEGAPFVSPSGIAVDTNGTTYVVDQKSVLSVTGGTATVLASGLVTGFPGGIAFSANGTELYVASSDPTTGNDAVAVVSLTPGQTVTYQLGGASGPFAGFSEPGGLHGIGTLSTFVDATAAGSGAVYVVQ